MVNASQTYHHHLEKKTRSLKDSAIKSSTSKPPLDVRFVHSALWFAMTQSKLNCCLVRTCSFFETSSVSIETSRAQGAEWHTVANWI